MAHFCAICGTGDHKPFDLDSCLKICKLNGNKNSIKMAEIAKKSFDFMAKEYSDKLIKILSAELIINKIEEEEN